MSMKKMNGEGNQINTWCGVDELSIAPDYNKILGSRTVFITGMGRSGTTILGRIIGSLDPVCYVHEPHVLRYIPLMYAATTKYKRQQADIIKAVIFEDFLLQLIHGRTVNFNTLDISYRGNYESLDRVKERWKKFRRRSDVIDFLKSNEIIFVIKLTNIQPLLFSIRDIFPEALFIHSIRNANDVINSTLYRRGWFTDTYFNENYLNWIRRDPEKVCNVPWFLDEESAMHFSRWNPVTRGASVWRNLNQNGLVFCQQFPEECFDIRHEALISSLDAHIVKIIDFIKNKTGVRLKTTECTEKTIDSVANYGYQKYDSLLNQIEEPELGKFNEFMKELNYCSSDLCINS